VKKKVTPSACGPGAPIVRPGKNFDGNAGRECLIPFPPHLSERSFPSLTVMRGAEPRMLMPDERR
jgi:hypothetical protein